MSDVLIRTATVAWFSGTGGTKRVAEAFERELASAGAQVRMDRIGAPEAASGLSGGKPELLVLVFAVHAFDAPAPVYGWIEGRDLAGIRAAVISVSGGGEGWPNTGCRANVCAALERQGATVTYDTMMIMPCNWVFPETDDQAAHLLRLMPEKVRQITQAIRSGETRRTAKRLSLMRSWISKLEKAHTDEFPNSITVSAVCTGCGVCAKGCPVGNIEIRNGKPAFNAKCVMCFRCVYACPKHAMTSNNFMVLKQGFDIDALEKRMAGKELPPAAKCFKGMHWKGVREYLMDRDGKNRLI